VEQYGADALRFTLLVGSSPGNDVNLSLKKVEANRNFANKVWNAGRFVISALEKAPDAPQGAPAWTLADSWIWARLQETIREVNRLFGQYLYGEAGRQIYEFFWDEFADWYLETAKLQLAEGGDRAFYTAQTLVKVLDLILRLLHPYTPYITEELWGHLKAAVKQRFGPENSHFTPEGGWPEALIIAPWPEPRPAEGWEEAKVKAFRRFQEAVRAIRNLRAEHKVKPGQRLGAVVVAGEDAALFQEMLTPLAALAWLDSERVTITEALAQPPEGHVTAVAGTVLIHLPMADLADPEEERRRLEKELGEVESQIARLENLLAGPFAKKAPPHVVAKEREKLETYRAQAEKLRARLAELG